MEVTEDFPTPPLPLMTAMTFLILLACWALVFSGCVEGQLPVVQELADGQEPQASLMIFSSFLSENQRVRLSSFIA
ncbi:hypothetical protein HMPREF0322_02890 [Desulfitobacterium hafniense DP7]|uniref:Uncharacterized protein n=1 Tax=Desulfitobacterium hafniense DP7 TaxID=537010 RepID=G9XPJ3_DESHA|nr:hypothetical protein HMPREF0322_02890 [Desulfitobacterium hafniense DP7]